MRILFFPSDLGGGFGHISRCLSIAHEARKREHICALVTNTDKYKTGVSSEFQTYTIKTNWRWDSIRSGLKNVLSRSNTSSPVFMEFSGLDFQVIRDGLINEKIVKKILGQYVQVVESFKPHLLVGDTNFLVWMLSKKTDVPVVQIVRYASHPKTAKLIWWKNKPEYLYSPDSSDLFNPLLNEMSLKPIKRAEDLLKGDLYIVPSIPEIEPVPTDERTFHVGELTVPRSSGDIPSFFNEINGRQPLVYVTIGGGAGPVGNKLFFLTIIEAFAKKNIQVVVSTSSKFDLKDFANAPPNIRFYNWVPGKPMISKADLVIFHGGYGTMMESIAYGKPTITIPFHTEQEGNGRRLEQLGSGIVVKLSRENFKRIESKWKYGTYSYLVQERYDLTAEELSGEVNKVLTNKKYLDNALRFQAKVKEYRGSEETMELIEKLLS